LLPLKKRPQKSVNKLKLFVLKEKKLTMQRELLPLRCRKQIKKIKQLKPKQSKPRKLPKKLKNLPRKRKI